MEEVLTSEQKARLEANLRLTPAQRLAQVTSAARFVLDGRRAMAAAARTRA